MDRVHEDASRSRRRRRTRTTPSALINERFKGKAYEWLNYRFDQRGYLPDPRDPDATPPEELFIVPRDGGEARQLTQDDVNVSGVAWRPDSGALAFVANEFQRDEYTYARADLWTVTLDGKVKRLTNDGYDHDSPAWSPDGRACGAARAGSERGDRVETDARRADRRRVVRGRAAERRRT